jgi:hypothetical protein
MKLRMSKSLMDEISTSRLAHILKMKKASKGLIMEAKQFMMRTVKVTG